MLHWHQRQGFTESFVPTKNKGKPGGKSLPYPPQHSTWEGRATGKGRGLPWSKLVLLTEAMWGGQPITPGGTVPWPAPLLLPPSSSPLTFLILTFASPSPMAKRVGKCSRAFGVRPRHPGHERGHSEGEGRETHVPSQHQQQAGPVHTEAPAHEELYTSLIVL